MEKIYIIAFLLGFILSSPLGPIGLICLRRTLTKGRKSGIISGLGISVAYAFWSFAAIHGVQSISHWIEEEKFILEMVIAIFFLLHGLHGLLNFTRTIYKPTKRNDMITEFLSTFLVVFINPGTFLMFVIYFALFGVIKDQYSIFDSLAVAFSVFSGSIIFWLILTQFLHKIKNKINDSIYLLLSRASSFIIMIFGIIILIYSLLTNLF